MRLRDLILVALFAALTALGALIQIPMAPVQITLQLLFCILSGMLLGPVPGALSQAVYVLLGLVGLPVFAGGGGLGYVLKPSFGYLVGFVAGAFVCGLVVRRVKKLTFIRALLAGLVCILTVYAVGAPYLYVSMNLSAPGSISAGAALTGGFLVFLPGDALKCLVAALAALKLKPALSRLEPRH